MKGGTDRQGWRYQLPSLPEKANKDKDDDTNNDDNRDTPHKNQQKVFNGRLDSVGMHRNIISHRMREQEH
jgi:hypothetical protein